MRGISRVLGRVALVGGALVAWAVLLTVFSHPGTFALPEISAQGIGAGLLFAGLVGGPARALTYARLAELGNPQNGNEPQAIRHVLYDTASVTTAVTTSMTFFNTARGDLTLSNLVTPGQMASGQYFEICYVGCDVLCGVSQTTDVTGILQDIQQMMLQQRPTFTLDYNSKNYGPYPLSFAHTSGGAVGVVASGATAVDIQQGNNGVSDGGWAWGGGVILCPSVAFSVNVRFAAAPTITQGPLPLRFWFEGILSRNVT